MLSRKNLAPLKKDFSRIRRNGKNYDSPSFGLLVSYQTEAPEPQCAFIVSKKIDKRSVVRHEVKRKLADAITSFLPRLPKNTELVFLTKQKAALTTKEELIKEMDVILHRANLLK